MLVGSYFRSIFQIWGMVSEMLILGLFCDGLGPFSPSPTARLCSAPVVGGGQALVTGSV